MKKLTEREKTELYAEVYPIALEFRKSFISEKEVIKDTFRAVEQLGFLLMRFPALGGNTSLGGFTIEKTPYHCIYINSRQNLGRQYMSCWHECYHIHTGEGNGLSYVDSSKQDSIEYKAEVFAGMVLMPENLVEEYIRKNNISLGWLSHMDIIHMQNYFRVGYSAMLNRILQIYPDYKEKLNNRFGLASRKRIEEMKEKTLSAGGDLRLVQPTEDVYLPPSFFGHIEFNLRENRISKEKAYALLKAINGLGK